MEIWLEALKEDLHAITTPAARELWPGPGGRSWFNYRWEHVLQVERDALRLLRAVGGDRDVVLASAWVHDRYQSAFTGEDHGPRAADWATASLATHGFPAAKVERVCACVRDHSGRPHTLPEQPLEARLLWDADKLAHLGAFEILMHALSTSARDLTGAMLADPAFARRGLVATVWEPAIVRLRRGLGSGGLFYFFPVSCEIARERIAAEQTFLSCLEAQLR